MTAAHVSAARIPKTTLRVVILLSFHRVRNPAEHRAPQGHVAIGGRTDCDAADAGREEPVRRRRRRWRE